MVVLTLTLALLLADDRIIVVEHAPSYVELATAVAVFVSPIILGMLQYRAANKLKEVATITASKVEEVKTDLADHNEVVDWKMDKIESTTNKVHTLVNNSMGVMLKKYADLAELRAGETGSVTDIGIAQAARKASEEHDAKQSIVDKDLREREVT